MKNKVVELLKNSNLTIGSIESLTGGLFASNLTSIPGVSKVFKGSVVSYATEVKEMVVNVSKDVVTNYGVVSKECALEMALNGKKLLGVDVCVSFTGNAGPSAMENKEVGIYVHIPFCKRKCDYCDFISYSNKIIIQSMDSNTKEEFNHILVFNGKDIRLEYFRPVPKFYKLYKNFCEAVYYDLGAVDPKRE